MDVIEVMMDEFETGVCVILFLCHESDLCNDDEHDKHNDDVWMEEEGWSKEQEIGWTQQTSRKYSVYRTQKHVVECTA